MALAAVGWADGQLDREEADAIVRTALEEGLDIDDIDEIAEIEEATKSPVDIGIIDRRTCPRRIACSANLSDERPDRYDLLAPSHHQ